MELLNHYIGKEDEMKDNIVKGFDNKEEFIEKSISVEDFEKSYSKDEYEIYTRDNMKEYLDDIQKSINQNSEKEEEILSKAKEDIANLSKVNVQKGRDVKSFWVRKKETETENSEEK